jgi:hypothetical protein
MRDNIILFFNMGASSLTCRLDGFSVREFIFTDKYLLQRRWAKLPKVRTDFVSGGLRVSLRHCQSLRLCSIQWRVGTIVAQSASASRDWGNSIRIAAVPTGIRTDHLTNISGSNTAWVSLPGRGIWKDNIKMKLEKLWYFGLWHCVFHTTYKTTRCHNL